MHIKSPSSLLVLFILITGGISINSCSSNDCSLTGRPSARFDFFNSITGAVFTINDTLTIHASGTDSILDRKSVV